MPRAERAASLFFVVLLALTLIVYWPGLSGPFLFDDFPNLAGLGNFGGVRDWESFRQFVFTGIAGPTGRPLALASFLIDDNAWPSNPYAFKYTNLMLHLLTGVLLVVLLRQLLAIHAPQQARRNLWIALAVAGFWLLHPMNVSTVLYVVQRMAILSALFTVLALIGYACGRRLLAERPRTAYLTMGLALVFGTAAATLSKENGILTPVLALVLEETILRRHSGPRPHLAFRLLFLWVPLAAIPAYFSLIAWSGRLAGGYAYRPFTLPERLLTQACALWEYVGHWLLPRPGQRGLYADDYPVSHGLLDPWYTLPAVFALIAATATALWLRIRQPLVAAAILFYLAGHLLESSFVPLELYFEHRNYLPAMLLALPVAFTIATAAIPRRLRAAGGALALLIPALLTGWLALLWRDEVQLAVYWARQHPQSVRAETVVESVLEQAGRRALALQFNEQARVRHPDEIALAANFLLLRCRLGGVGEADFATVLPVFARGKYDHRLFEQMRALVNSTQAADCRGLDGDSVRLLLATLADNPTAQEPHLQRQFHHLVGTLELLEGRGDAALLWYGRSQAARPDPDLGLLEVATLATHGWLQLALKHLSQIEAGLDAGARGPLADYDYRLAAERLRIQIQRELDQADGKEPRS